MTGMAASGAGVTERWTRACERRDSSGVSLDVRAMRTIPGCIARAPAQVGKGVYREVPRISGSPQKSAGQIWVFVRCEPFLDASYVEAVSFSPYLQSRFPPPCIFMCIHVSADHVSADMYRTTIHVSYDIYTGIRVSQTHS